MIRATGKAGPLTGLGGGIYVLGVVKLFDAASVTRNTASHAGGGFSFDGDTGGILTAHTGWTGKIKNNEPNDCNGPVPVGDTICD